MYRRAQLLIPVCGSLGRWRITLNFLMDAEQESEQLHMFRKAPLSWNVEKSEVQDVLNRNKKFVLLPALAFLLVGSGASSILTIDIFPLLGSKVVVFTKVSFRTEHYVHLAARKVRLGVLAVCTWVYGPVFNRMDHVSISGQSREWCGRS